MSPRRRTAIVVVAALVSGVLIVATAGALQPRHPQIVVKYTGRSRSTTTQPAVVLTAPPPTAPPTTGPFPAPGPAVGLAVADGHPYGAAIEFHSDIAVPDGLVFVLVVGSDARPGEDVLRTRADSIHLLAANPKTGQATIVGFPRDSYVQYPNGGRGKINEAMARGGPAYLADTIRRLSGLPVDYVAVTSFVGIQHMVDALGGVDVLVERRMADRFSGAFFQPGWHHFTGGQALAYCRDRHDVPDGDFGRSAHQGNVILATLGKMRAEVGDDTALLRWVSVLTGSTRLDVPADRLAPLAALARHLDPARVRNVVLPGRVGNAGAAGSVVYLTADAPALFTDLRDDAVIGTAAPA